MLLAATTNALIRTLLAPTCAACDGILDRPLDGPVCAVCWRAIPRLTPPYCVRCGDALASGRESTGPCCDRCRQLTSLVTLTRSAGVYDGSLRRIIHAFKYDGRRALATRIAALMREAGADLLAGADVVVPVPLHPWRAFRRGFNQADDLARHLGPPVWRVLRRRRHGPPQASLPAAERHANVRAAYALRPSLPRPARDRLMQFEPGVVRQLRNRSIVLVDDVMTTGATLEACARVLAAAGVRKIAALTAARALAGSLRPRPTTLHPSPAPRR